MGKVELEIINSYRPRTYLEIGISGGWTFVGVTAGLKDGVDPEPHMRHGDYTAVMSKDREFGRTSVIYPLPSDEFFLRGLAVKYDVIFVDGGHTYDQAMRDIENGMRCLSEPCYENSRAGVILVHDVKPENAFEGRRWEDLTKEEVDGIYSGKLGSWNGDVWKCAVELGDRGVDFETLDVPCGMMVIKKQEMKDFSEDRREEIRKLDYKYYEKNKKSILRIR